MARIELPIGGGFYQADSLPISAQNCINFMPVIQETQGALSSTQLYNVVGVKSFDLSPTVGANGRGSHNMGGIPFFVINNTLRSTDSIGVSTDIGTIEGTKRVSMADNGTKLVIVNPGGKSYVYDGATLVEITDADFIVSDTVSFKDGYFIFTASDGTVFFNSELNDPLSYNALDFGTSETDPDAIVSTVINHNQLYVVNKETIEPFQNIGGADFPFQRIEGAVIEKGAHSTQGIVALDDSFVFIGGGENEQTGMWEVSGSQLSKISTSAIDTALLEFTEAEISTCFAMTYTDRGQRIATFSINAAQQTNSKTFAYNKTATRLGGVPIWFEISSPIFVEFNPDTENTNWAITSIVRAYGKFLSTETSGAIGELHKEYNNEVAKREFTTSPFYNQDKNLYVKKLILTMQNGVGLNVGSLSSNSKTPTMRMSYSDNARIYSNEFPRDMGKIGEYDKEIEWRRLGRVPRFRVFKFKTTDTSGITAEEAVKVIVINMLADVESGI